MHEKSGLRQSEREPGVAADFEARKSLSSERYAGPQEIIHCRHPKTSFPDPTMALNQDYSLGYVSHFSDHFGKSIHP
jgi:hypothetical protein